MFKILVSNSNNPYINQTIESQLFYDTDDFVLFVYINEPSVVIGRNQNPWKEIQMDHLDVNLVRRLSGGGTVYHDYGNVNFSFVYTEGQTTIKNNFDYILYCISKLDVKLHITERNDLFYQNKKVSGNAFYRRGNRRMHHGTILVDVDTSDLWKVLNFDHDSYVCKSVPSVKSDIINLKTIKPNLTVHNVITALSEGKESYGHIEVNDDSLTYYQSSSWMYEETPKFKYLFNGYEIEIVSGYVKSDIKTIDNKMFDETFVKKEVEHVSRII